MEQIFNKTSKYFFINMNNFAGRESKEDFEKVIFPFVGNETYFNFFGRQGFY